MRRILALLAGVCLTALPAAQSNVHFPPTDRIVIQVMRDVPAAQLAPGFLGRTVVGATGSFTFAEFEPGTGAALHHHTREQANVGIEGLMEMGLGTHTEPLPAGSGVITPANVSHAIRNTSGGRLTSIEFHTIRRPDLAPPRPRPSVPYPRGETPVAVPDTSRLVVQLEAGQPAGEARVIKGETCTLGWRRLAPGAAATNLVATPSEVELFVYVVSGEADVAGREVARRVGPGTLLLIPGGERNVMMKAAGAAPVALVEFRPSLQ